MCNLINVKTLSSFKANFIKLLLYRCYWNFCCNKIAFFTWNWKGTSLSGFAYITHLATLKKDCTDLLEEAHYRQGGAVHWKPQSILGPVVYCKQGCAGLCRGESHVVPLLLLCKKQERCPDGAIRKEKQNIRSFNCLDKTSTIKN